MRPWLFITVDPEHHIALLRGREAKYAARLVTGPIAAWSRSTGGWVIPERNVADIVALGQYLHELVVVHNRRPA